MSITSGLIRVTYPLSYAGRRAVLASGDNAGRDQTIIVRPPSHTSEGDVLGEAVRLRPDED